MKRNTINLILDISLGFLFYFLLVSGIVLMYILPPGSHSSTIFGMTRHELGTIHFWTAITATAILLVHLALHWTWVHNVVANKLGRKSGSKIGRKKYISGVAVLLGVIGITTGVLFLSSRYKITRQKQGDHNQIQASQAEHAPSQKRQRLRRGKSNHADNYLINSQQK